MKERCPDLTLTSAAFVLFPFLQPVLARDYHVFAFCKLGFGLSSKPVQEYSAEVWR